MGLISLARNLIGLKASPEQIGAVTSAPAKYRNPSTAARDLLRRYHQWTYTCSTRNATAVASVPLRLYGVTRPGDRAVRAPHRPLTRKELGAVRRTAPAAPGDNIVEITSHPVLDLLTRISANADNYETLELTELYLELAGNSYWYISYSSLGIPDDIVVLRPDLVKIVPGETVGSVQGYVYGYGKNRVELAPDEVVHYKFPNPLDPHYYGMSPLRAVLASDEQYQRTIEYETALAQNNAVPSLGIQYDGVIPGDEIKKVEADWNRALRGTAKTGKIKVFDNRFDVKQFQLTPAELNFLEGRRWTREEIAGAYGVPLSLLTTGDVNLANAKVGERTYAKWTVLPRLCRLADRLNAALQLWYGEPRIFLAYDSPVPEDNEFELKRAVQLAGSSIITRDEARQMQGIDPVGGATGDEWIPSTSHNQPGEKSCAQKPRRNEHEFVLREAHNFETFRRVNDDFGRGIDVIYGITADDDTHIFAILFGATTWTFEAAKHWIREHGYEPIESHRATDPLAKEI